ncbi:MAG: hypothetical protein AW10_02726 [Candidatus Accumulibacter appositus]|uniref:Transmembrane protein n=1 Tax=Candidatus Accumulibacter appositus TaxID=1454003 RepID=A0A011PPQ1_9PROT|nr:hypothetical protein [Accumulibacter sp.]EXI78855.1 MAG: hypothetical protein AW10_02726 [Candidatus Accumulibacter appositus]HRF05531.1 hypothetical protein [Accumulibacter sp.]
MPLARQLILALLVAGLVACSWLAPLDASATQQADAGLKRALLSFATARALNAAISVAQGTEVSVQPGGMGVVLTPGEVLDPVNDLVEQFSNVMLAASVAFGVQKMLISMAGYWLISLLMSAAALCWAWFHFRREALPAWLSRTLVILLMLRFAVPAVTIGSDLLFEKFLVADYDASQQVMSAAPAQVARLDAPQPLPSGEQGLLDRIKGWGQDLEVKARFDALQQAAEQATEHIITLIVIFLLQTVVIPLLLLSGLYGLARAAFQRPPR